jgi:hypothetical protein
MEAVGEVDLVHGTIRARPRVGERVCDRRDREDASAFRHQLSVSESSSRMEDSDALHLLGSLYLSD